MQTDVAHSLYRKTQKQREPSRKVSDQGGSKPNTDLFTSNITECWAPPRGATQPRKGQGNGLSKMKLHNSQQGWNSYIGYNAGGSITRTMRWAPNSSLLVYRMCYGSLRGLSVLFISTLGVENVINTLHVL